MNVKETNKWVKEHKRYKLFTWGKKTLKCDHCGWEETYSTHTYERICFLADGEIDCLKCGKGKMELKK